MESSTTDNLPITVNASGTRFDIGTIGGSGTRRKRAPRSGDGGDYPTTETPQGEQNASGLSEASGTAVTSRRRKASDVDAATAADTLVGAIESLGVLRYGDAAKLELQERRLFTRGFNGSMQQLPSRVTKQIATISSPLMVAMGFLFYTSRLSALETKRRANINESTRSAQADAVLQAQEHIRTNAATNGHVPTASFDPSHVSPANLDAIGGIMDV